MIVMHISCLVDLDAVPIVFLLQQRSLAPSNWFLEKPRLMTNF